MKKLLFALMLLSSSIYSQISYTDFMPDVTLTGFVQASPNGDTMLIDFNNDGNHEYELTIANNAGLKFAYIQSGQNNPPNNEIHAPSSREITPMGNNDTINSSISWETVNGGNLILMTDLAGTTSGSWVSVADAFVGCKFKIGTNTHYGWIRLGISLNNDSLMIKSMAYNTLPDACVIPGDTTTFSCIPSSTSLTEQEKVASAEVYPNPSDDKITVTHTLTDQNNFSIIDLTGKVVLNRTNYLSGREVDMSNLKSGIYLYSLTDGESNVTGRIVVNH